MTVREICRPAGCPPWCDVPDHWDLDGNQGSHSAHETIPLSAYPFTAHGEVWHETIIIGLGLDLDDVVTRDGAPFVEIIPRSEAAGDVMRLTLEEAGQVAGALTRLLAAARR